MKSFALFSFLLVTNLLCAQTFERTFNSSGYREDGKKVGEWNYFFRGKKQLTINYTTGEVPFILRDTSKYFVSVNGNWESMNVDEPPIPVEGMGNFRDLLKDSIFYPLSVVESKKEGKSVVYFEVDTLGLMQNYSISNSINQVCDDQLLRTLKKIDQKWIPAKRNGKKLTVRLALIIDYRLDENLSLTNNVLIQKGKPMPFEIIAKKERKKFDSSELMGDPAEFPGGQENLAKWLSEHLKYPKSAKRMGLEGKVFVKFFVEPDGSIGNPTVLKGFDAACDREAVRVISIMPKWKPGRYEGKPVSTYFTQVIVFRLN